MSMIQIGKLQLNSPNGTEVTTNTSTFTQVAFPSPFPDNAAVIVVPFVQTFNGADTPGLRITDVTTTGFKIRINELVGGSKAISDGIHTHETVAWIASTV
ncbi:hypothetical protein [Streptomyces lavendulocolor]|uniref:hypothetical protein n=1 Tax=Streptomyces lavendulocolor TaxID=67316 RepID=UPI0033F8A753